MYIMNVTTGMVFRSSDGKHVAPCDNPNDVDYLDYLNWVSLGNTPPIITTNIPEANVITKLAFRNRFSITEKIQIELMSIDNPTASASARTVSAIIRVFFEDIDQALCIDLSDTNTQLAVKKMEEFGILSETRVSEILNTPPSDAERPFFNVS